MFELWRDGEEWREDMGAVLKGDLVRIAVPEDNLLDVNYAQLQHFFPGHAMFTNFSKLLPRAWI